jgi:hypothetical protein
MPHSRPCRIERLSLRLPKDSKKLNYISLCEPHVSKSMAEVHISDAAAAPT